MSSELDMNGMVRLIFKKPQICGSRGTIPPVEIFGERLATVLRHFDCASKILFVEGAHKLALRKLEFERLGEHYRQQETTLRASIKNHSKLITLVARAIKTLEKAHSAAALEDAQLLDNFEVTEAMRMLIAAKNEQYIFFCSTRRLVAQDFFWYRGKTSVVFIRNAVVLSGPGREPP